MRSFWSRRRREVAQLREGIKAWGSRSEDAHVNDNLWLLRIGDPSVGSVCDNLLQTSRSRLRCRWLLQLVLVQLVQSREQEHEKDGGNVD